MGEQDSTFAKMPYEFERSKSGKQGKKKDIPLCEVPTRDRMRFLTASFLIAYDICDALIRRRRC